MLQGGKKSEQLERTTNKWPLAKEIGSSSPREQLAGVSVPDKLAVILDDV